MTNDRLARLVRVIRALTLVGALGILAVVVLVPPTRAESPAPSNGAGASAVDASPAPSDVDEAQNGTGGTAGDLGGFVQPTPEPIPAGPTLPPAPPAIVHPSDGSSNTCYDCHSKVNPKQREIAAQWQASVHGQAGIICADCHGGDPTSSSMSKAMDPAAGFIGKPSKQATAGVCGSCHADPKRMSQYQLPTDEYSKYATSVHGLRLATGDARVAVCTDCHGSHDIKKPSDPTAPTYPTNIPKLCASCHADANLMKAYDIPTDQYAIYEQSVHGKLLLSGDMRAPNCASCHGSHDAKPPTSASVVNVCGKCHTATQKLYDQSKHATLSVGPKCWTCHGTHDVQKTTDERFLHPTPVEVNCNLCHDPTTNRFALKSEQFKNDADRRCDTCHHPSSFENSQSQGIHDVIAAAATEFSAATSRIQEAADLGMIVTDADVSITEARTNLIQARATVHTTDLAAVAKFTDASIAKSKQAEAFADAQLADINFRRQAMLVVVLLIGMNVGGLAFLRHRLHNGK